MAQQNLNTGTTPNDGSGDSLRCAFIKTETNFADLYSCIGGIDTSISNINSCLTMLDDSTDQFELFSWGFNNCGQLGTNDTICYSTPTQEACGGINWCMVSSGSGNTLAIKTDGTLWGWGFNNVFGSVAYGTLGTGDSINYSTPTQEHCGGTNWCMVSAGFYHTSAIKTDGTLWGWGDNFCGKLGTNSIIRYSTPTQEHCGGTNWCMISAGGTHTSAIKTDGTLWGWGSNFCGVLGLNNTTNYSTPQQEACGGTNWCTVSSGGTHTSAIKTDGTLWSRGINQYGQLGLNNLISYSSPTQEVCGGTTWCMVSAGDYHTLAIKNDGTLWSWGINSNGRLGTNNTTCYSTPTQEVCSGTNWCTVNGGIYHTSAIKTDGTLWSWGCNNRGQLGTNNSFINYSTPQQESCGGTNWCMVNAGDYHTSAIRID